MPAIRQRCSWSFSARASWAIASLGVALACSGYEDEAPPTLRSPEAGSGGSGAVSVVGSGGVPTAGSGGSAAGTSTGTAGVDAAADSSAGTAGADADASGADAGNPGAVDGSGPSDGAGAAGDARDRDGSACAESWVIERDDEGPEVALLGAPERIAIGVAPHREVHADQEQALKR